MKYRWLLALYTMLLAGLGALGSAHAAGPEILKDISVVHRIELPQLMSSGAYTSRGVVRADGVGGAKQTFLTFRSSGGKIEYSKTAGPDVITAEEFDEINISLSDRSVPVNPFFTPVVDLKAGDQDVLSYSSRWFDGCQHLSDLVQTPGITTSSSLTLTELKEYAVQYAYKYDYNSSGNNGQRRYLYVALDRKPVAGTAAQEGNGLLCSAEVSSKQTPPTATATPTPTSTRRASCTPPPCQAPGRLQCGGNDPRSCQNGCGYVCVVPPTLTPTPTRTQLPMCTPPPCSGGKLECPAGKECKNGCGYVCVVPPTLTPTPTRTQLPMCTPPPCSGGKLECPAGKECKNGCGYVCVVPPTLTPTPTRTQQPMCTPPPCSGGKLQCPAGKSCPNGCGVVCVRPTVTATPTATFTSRAQVACTPPPCSGGRLQCPAGKSCPNGCGVVCVRPTSTATPTATATKTPVR